MVDPVLQKLSNIMGPVAGPRFVSETCRSLGLADLTRPEDRMRFACELIKRGGMYEAIGRAIKIQALLHGAQEP